MKPKRLPVAVWRQSPQACGAFSALRSSYSCPKTYLRMDQFRGGGSPSNGTRSLGHRSAWPLARPAAFSLYSLSLLRCLKSCPINTAPLRRHRGEQYLINSYWGHRVGSPTLRRPKGRISEGLLFAGSPAASALM